MVFISEQVHYRVRQAQLAQGEFAIDDVNGKTLNFGLARFPEHRSDGEACHQRQQGVGDAPCDADELRGLAGFRERGAVFDQIRASRYRNQFLIV